MDHTVGGPYEPSAIPFTLPHRAIISLAHRGLTHIPFAFGVASVGTPWTKVRLMFFSYLLHSFSSMTFCRTVP